MWSYVFFFIHLDNMKQSDYTAVELYVSRLVSNDPFFSLPYLKVQGALVVTMSALAFWSHFKVHVLP